MTTFDASDGVVRRVLQRRGVRQFVKFCLVGATSTVVDFGVWLFLMQVVGFADVFGSLVVGRNVAQTISFLLAVSNGFIWNNRWTFKDPEREGHHRRFGQFVLTNVIGLMLNMSILNLVAHHVPPEVLTLLPHGLKDPAGFVGKLVATAVVVFWNFTASKYWTFKN